MNDLVARAYCVVPSEVLKALLFAGIGGGIFLSIARLAGMNIPSAVMIGLIGFFLAGAMLASHRLSILRKPGLVLLGGVICIMVTVHLQDAILRII